MYLPVTPETVPAELTWIEQWVGWRPDQRDGKATKVPIDPLTGDYASVADPTTWTDFHTAYEYYRVTDDCAGVGFVFTVDDPYVGVDLDDCRDPEMGALEDWARDVIRRLESYTEASPSGTGVHVIAKGAVSDDGNRNGDVEVYQTDRYFTVTGRHLSLTPARIHERTAELAGVHAEYVTDTTTSDTVAETTTTPPSDAGSERSDPDLSDRELLEYAKNASNGDKFERLWNGDTSGYPSHSEADQALCNLLAFWTGGDPRRIERLFSKSGLVREKWREREDYRERTIRKAIRDCPSYYSP